MIIENLKTRKYCIKGDGRIFTHNSLLKFDSFKQEAIEISLLKTPWDSNTLIDKSSNDKPLGTKFCHLNLYLESYQPKDTYFEHILNVMISSSRTSLWTLKEP